MLSASMIAALLGGIGLFLLGMRLITEGLKLVAGRALRGILTRSTGTRLRGVLSGALITSIVQSSSAVTVATILSAQQAGFRRLVVEMLDRAEVGSKDFSLDRCAAALAGVEEAYQAIKNSFLRAGTHGDLRVRAMVDVLDLYSDIRRMAQQAEKGALQLASLEAFSRDKNAR